MDRTYDYIFKIILIGDSGVGKTSLMNRFTDDEFQEGSAATIGVDFKIKTLKIDNTKVKMQIWDTAGQERFRAVVSNYYRGANGIFVVFDLTNRASFNHLGEWLSEIEKKGALTNSEIMILGNKLDSKENIKVSRAEVDELVKKNNISQYNYLEVSAKNSTGVEESFREMCRKLIAKYGTRPVKSQDKATLILDTIKNRNRCC